MGSGVCRERGHMEGVGLVFVGGCWGGFGLVSGGVGVGFVGA